MAPFPLNRSEAFVTEICHETFLSLWCYANPRAKIGHELCDLLVVCDPNVLIISVKEIRLNPDKELEIAHARWERKAVDASVSQIYGAERWLAGAVEVTLNDGSIGLPLPPPERRRIYRLAVALGGNEEVIIKSGDFGQGFVHVMTEESFRVVLTELDTVTDLTGYLAAKEQFTQSTSLVVCEGPESSMLGWYLLHGRSFPSGDYVMFDATIWAGLRTRSHFRAAQSGRSMQLRVGPVNRGLADPSAKPVAGPGPKLTDLETALRAMARESRFNRRVLGKFTTEFFGRARTEGSAARMVQGPSGVLCLVYFRRGTPHAERSAAGGTLVCRSASRRLWRYSRRDRLRQAAGWPGVIFRSRLRSLPTMVPGKRDVCARDSGKTRVFPGCTVGTSSYG